MMIFYILTFNNETELLKPQRKTKCKLKTSFSLNFYKKESDATALLVQCFSIFKQP